MLSLNLSLNVDDLTTNRIGKHKCLGLLVADQEGKICLLDEFDTESDCDCGSDICLESPANSVISESRSLSDFEFVKAVVTDSEKEEKEDKYKELSDRITSLDSKLKYEDVLKVLRNKMEVDVINNQIQKCDEYNEIHDKLYNLTDKYDDLNVKYTDLMEQVNEITTCVCECNHLNDQKITESTFPEKYIFSWDQYSYESLTTTKNKFVKLEKGKLVKCDILSNCLGVTLDDNVESEICINGICIVEEYKKGICNVGRKCSIKDGLAMAGSNYIVLERIDENHIKILLK